MSNEFSTSSDNQEIDLSLISKKIKNRLHDFNFSIYKGIRFLLKNIIIIAVLFILGGALGYYIDKGEKSYSHQIIVAPNFQSTDYLYGKIELINSKIESNDTIFLRSIGIKNPKSLMKIEITPIVDIYSFVRNTPDNFELLKLISQDKDIDKVLKDNITGKNYSYHLINFFTKGMIDKAGMITPLLDYLNNSDYYKILQKTVIANVIDKIRTNDETLAQINQILTSFANSGAAANVKNDKMVYINENSQLNDVLKTKYELLTEQGNRKIELINYEKIVKDVSTTINIQKISATNGKMVIIIPMFFLFLFIAVVLFTRFYKKQTLRYNSQTESK